LVFTYKEKVIPIEIKSGSTGSLKSLHQFMERTNHPYAVRMYAGEFCIEKTKTPGGTPYIPGLASPGPSGFRSANLSAEGG
jgi:hypothetical protein